jgi:hypothetical protein
MHIWNIKLVVQVRKNTHPFHEDSDHGNQLKQFWQFRRVEIVFCLDLQGICPPFNKTTLLYNNNNKKNTVDWDIQDLKWTNILFYLLHPLAFLTPASIILCISWQDSWGSTWPCQPRTTLVASPCFLRGVLRFLIEADLLKLVEPALPPSSSIDPHAVQLILMWSRHTSLLCDQSSQRYYNCIYIYIPDI